MDKQILKTVLTTLKADDNIIINFNENLSSNNGNYKVLTVAKGRGKGGSYVMTAMNLGTGATLTSLPVEGKNKLLGTPVSSYILNITFNGQKFGTDTQDVIIDNYPKDKEAGKQMKEILMPFVGKKEPTKVIIKSNTAPEFNGTWMITEARLHAGRGGQVSLLLTDTLDSSRTKELWSYRHSQIIDHFETVEETTPTTEPTEV
jgi:hypothetical protein